MAKKVTKKDRIIFKLNYRPQNVKVMQKTVFVGVGCEVTQWSDNIIDDFDENLEKFKFWAWYMEKYTAKCKNQIFISKVSL